MSATPVQTILSVQIVCGQSADRLLYTAVVCANIRALRGDTCQQYNKPVDTPFVVSRVPCCC